MKIIKTECFVENLVLKQSYTIAYETINEFDNVFLKVETDKGITGWGCAAPDKPVTGETSATVLESYRTKIEPYMKGKDVFEYARLLEELKNIMPNQSSALAMVDMAIYDLIAQKAGVPLYKLLGGFRNSITTSITIGIMDVRNTIEEAKRYVKQGFNILKVKGGNHVDEDVERLKKIREIFKTSVIIRFDANQGYSFDESIRFMEQVKALDVEIFEQPTTKDQSELLKQVTLNVPVPVMADESLRSLSDAFHLTSNGCADMINIKLMKVGGIYEGLHINSVARAANVEVMIGCMDESELGIAAGLHLALSRKNIEFADLDGHLDIKNDPFKSLFQLKNGVLIPSGRNGLGVG